MVVDISNNILKWVIESIKVDKVSRASILSWQSGKKKPTLHQLEALSKKLRVPFGYFFLNEPPQEQLKIIDYRTVDSVALNNPSRELHDTVRHMQNIQDWMIEYAMTTTQSKVDFIGSIKKTDGVIVAAQKAREFLGIKSSWHKEFKDIDGAFNHFKKVISGNGILVMRSGIVGSNTSRKLNLAEFRAFALVNEYASLIFINTNDAKAGMFFSLFHELVHIGLGENNFYNVSHGTTRFVNPNETFCNAVTAELLVPDSMFIADWKTSSLIERQRIHELAGTYLCSEIVVARRALDKGWITQSMYDGVVSDTVKIDRSKKKGGRGNYYRTSASKIDHNFLLALNGSIAEGRTLYTDAYALTGTNRKTFYNLVKVVSGRQANE